MSGIESNQSYHALGLRRVLNAADTFTILGGGRLPDEVKAAMAAAGDHHVYIEELLKAAGAKIAQLTNNPAALVVNGSAAALAVSAAAAMTGAGPVAADSLPAWPGSKNEIIILRCQRNTYDRAVAVAGAKLVEVGYANGTPLWHVESAISEATAAILWFAGDEFERYAPTLEEMSAIARTHSIPLIVDAAAQFPPVSNLWRYRERGGDLVIFSGGKGLRGPQSSGLILGSEALITACASHSYPNHSIGRSMKTSKENIMGLLAAIERAVNLDWSAEYAQWGAIVEWFCADLGALEGVRAWTTPTGRLGQACPRAFFELDPGLFPTTAVLSSELAALDPSIQIGNDEGGPQVAYLNPYSLIGDEPASVLAAVVRTLSDLSEHRKQKVENAE